MQLSRMGSIPRESADYYGDASRLLNEDEDALARKKKAMIDLALSKQKERENEIDLARTGLVQKELERVTGEEAQGRDVRRRYQEDSNARDTIPLGVVNPRLLDKQEGMGPMESPSMRTGNLERETQMDLAAINPDMADKFRLGRQGEIQGAEDRRRTMAFADSKESREAQELAIKKRTQDETERKNRAEENIKWVESRRKGKASGFGGLPADKALKMRDSKANAVYELEQTEAVAQQLLDHPGLEGLTGAKGLLYPYIPGTKAKDASAIKNQLKAKAGFSALQNMRANSPTGGALGPVSDAENKLLQDATVALENSQSPEQYKKNLLNYIQQLRVSKQRINEAWKKDFGGEGFGAPDLNADDLEPVE